MQALHYPQKSISQVSSNDFRVCLIGNVIAIYNNSFVLDDGTGKIEISTDQQVKKNKVVRVFCSLANEKLKSDIVQNVENLDLNLFKKVKELYNSTGV